MTTTETLVLIAQISMALLAVSSIVALQISRRVKVIVNSSHLIRIENLLALGLVTTLLSLLPIIIAAIGQPDGTAVRISQLIMAGVTAAMIAVRFLPSYRLNRDKILDLGTFLLTVALLIVTIVSQLLSSVSPNNPAEAYVLGLASLLLATCISFYRTVRNGIQA